MGVAMLGPYRFRINPASASWDFTIKAVDIPTVGGKVVQVYGTEMGDMTVTGSFGKGGRAEQARWLQAMNKIGDEAMAKSRTKESVAPIRFLYPTRKWDFRVYLKGIGPVRIAPETHAPEWTLTLMIVEDNGNVRKVAQDAYIARLAAGLGWKLTEYNGSAPQSTIEAVQSEGGLEQYLINHYITGGAPTNATGAPTGG